MSSFSSSDIINVVIFLDPNIFVCIPASAADAAAVNPKGIKPLLANGLVTFFINGNPILEMNRVIYYEIVLIASSWIIEFLMT